MLSNSAAGQNLRHSRRSACDRCRAYKIRCQRDDRPGEPCERCLKANLTCRTTLDNPGQRIVGQQQQQPPGLNNSSGNEGGQTIDSAVEPPRSPPRDRDTGGYGPPSAARQLIQGQGHSDSHQDADFTVHPHRVETSSSSSSNPESQQQSATTLDSMDKLGLDSRDGVITLDYGASGMDTMDFSMTDNAFGANEIASILAGDNPTSRGDEARRSLVDNNDMLRFLDDNTTLGNGTDVDVLTWPTDLNKDMHQETSVSSSELQELQALQALHASCHKKLLNLSLELIEDQAMMNTTAPLSARPNHSALECPAAQQRASTNRLLAQTARMWDILKKLSMAEPRGYRPNGRDCSRSSSSGSSGGSFRRGGWTSMGSKRNYSGANGEQLRLSNSGSPRERRFDQLLTVSLVTTYVHLARSCGALFTRIYDAVEISLSGGANALLELPSLQFGDFQLENNLVIQVKVLIELISDMLARIGNALGINPTGGGGGSSEKDRELRLPFLSDPVAVSIREMILSQEMMQGGVHGYEPPLQDILDSLKALLERSCMI